MWKWEEEEDGDDGGMTSGRVEAYESHTSTVVIVVDDVASASSLCLLFL